MMAQVEPMPSMSHQFSALQNEKNYQQLITEVSFSMVSIIYRELWAKNIKREILEINNS